MTPAQPTRKRGRRPLGGPDTRALVLAAARELFAELGFERTTMREVAARAGVDPALIYHYYGNKDGLLDAALSPPPGAEVLLAGVVGDPRRAGEELVRQLIGLWDTDTGVREHMLAMVRTGLSHQSAAAVVRDRQRSFVTAAVGHVVADDRRDLRLSLVGAHIGGVLLTRYLLEAPAIADASVDDLARAIGPVLQHYLTGSLEGLVGIESAAADA